MNWRHGSLVTPPTPEAPASVGDDPSVAALLDAAEDIINSAGPSIEAQVASEQEKARGSKRNKWWPFKRK